MSSMNKSAIGKILRDRVTNLEGVCVISTEEINGNWRHAIILPAPADKSDTGKYHDVDAARYEIVGDGPMECVPQPEHIPHIELGSRVYDKFSKFTGFATQRCWSISGCTQYAVIGDGMFDKDGHTVYEWFDALRLVVMPEEKPVELPQTRTGSSLPSRGPCPRS